MITSDGIKRVKLETAVVHKPRYNEVRVKFRLPKLDFRGYNLRKPVHIAMTAVILLLIVAPIWNAAMTRARYKVSAKAAMLVGSSNESLSSKLVYDADTKAYYFNKDGDKPGADVSSEVVGGGKESVYYSAVMHEDPSKGFTLHDGQTDLSFGFKPLFRTMDGKNEDGRLVYPATSNLSQALYSFKYNGIKEDILLPRYLGDELSYQYQLELPSTLEARLMDGGGVGIYSADPMLFGNVQVASQADQAKLDGARNNGRKEHLAFAIPAPIIKQSSGGKVDPTASFTLEGNILTVKATGLKQAGYPLTIDPSFVVTSVGQFKGGNAEDNIDFDASGNQAKRGALTGGTVGAWTASAAEGGVCTGGTFRGFSLPTCTASMATAVYNSYIYVLGGCTVRGNCSGSPTNAVYYAKLEDDGTFQVPTTCTPATGSDAWCAATSLTSVRRESRAAAYNGYLYITGGIDNGSATMANVEYAKINADGSLGAAPGCAQVWCSANSLGAARRNHETQAYNGYLYAFGGYGSAVTSLKTAEFAAIKADGSLGSWQTTTDMGTNQERGDFGSAAYNGKLYALGGYRSQGGTVTQAIYTSIQSDGTLGTWSATTATPENIFSQRVVANNGYLYSVGANDSKWYYSQINSDGTLGAWSSLTNFGSSSNAYKYGGLVALNGHLIFMGGNQDNTGEDGQTTYVVRRAKINPAGSISTFATDSTGTLATARWGHTALVSGDNITVFFGCKGNISPNTNCPVADVLSYAQAEAATINTDGTLSSWRVNATPTCKIATLTVACAGNVSNRFGQAGINVNGRYFQIGGDKGNDLITGQSYATDTWSASISSDGTVNTWTKYTNSDLANARVWAQAAAFDLTFFVIGGAVASGTSGPLTLAQDSNVPADQGLSIKNNVNSGSGTAGWTRPTNSGTVMSPRLKHAMTSYNVGSSNLMYVLGGLDTLGSISQSNIKNDIYRVSWGGGSTLTWSQLCSTSCLGTNGRYGASATTAKDKLLVGGGVSDPSLGSYLTDISSATISTDGSLSTLATVGSLGTGRAFFGGLVYSPRDTFDVVGGISGGGVTHTAKGDAEYAVMNYGGSGQMGTWATTGSFSNPRWKFASAQYKNYLYVVGGDLGTGASGPSWTTSIQVGTISSNGSVSWASAGALDATLNTSGRVAAAAVAHNGFLYIIGGEDAGGIDAVVQRATINPTTGALSSWTAMNSLNYALEHHAAVIGFAGSTPYIYTYGGRNATTEGDPPTEVKDIQRASIDGSGNLSAWTTQSDMLAFRVRNSGISYYNGKIIAIGGGDYTPPVGSTTPWNNANMRPAGSLLSIDQTTGAITMTSNFGLASNIRAYGHSQIAYNGYIYTWGGTANNSSDQVFVNSSNSQSLVFSDTSISNNFNAGAAPTFVAYGGAGQYGGRFYQFGGCTDMNNAALDECTSTGNLTGATYYTSPQVIHRGGHYSRLFDSEADSTPTKLLIRGSMAGNRSSLFDLVFKTATSAAPTLGNTANFEPVSLGSLATVTPDSGGVDRYYWTRFTLDDSLSATFPDTAQTTLTDIELFYHPATARRLRGGKTFTGGAQQSLDASP